MKRSLFILSRPLCACFILLTIHSETKAQQYIGEKGKSIAFAKVIDDPNLPRVLIIGDSISIGYTPALRDILKGKANVHRIPTNGGPTSRGLAQIDKWLGDGNYDLIHFNWGLHDLAYINQKGKKVSPDQGQHQVPIKQYEENLKKLVARLKQTGAKLIWRNTTPVPAGCRIRIESDELPYNEVAARIMRENNIPIDDHHSYVIQHMKEVQIPNNVHFTPHGSKKLAELAAAAILKELKQ